MGAMLRADDMLQARELTLLIVAILVSSQTWPVGGQFDARATLVQR